MNTDITPSPFETEMRENMSRAEVLMLRLGALSLQALHDGHYAKADILYEALSKARDLYATLSHIPV